MEERLHTSPAVISRSRMECLIEGIFAIAMTLLVLDLKVPELQDRHSVSEMADALLRHAPTFFSYLFSFFMLGLLWYRHNRYFRHFQTITAGMLVLHLIQLASTAFFPFCAALIGRYPTNMLAQILYIGCLLVYAWAAFINWIVAGRSGVMNEESMTMAYRPLRKKLLRGCLIMTFFFAVYTARAFF